MKRFKIALFSLLLLFSFSCKQHYKIVKMEGKVIEMDSTWNTSFNTEMHALVQKYKVDLDREMSEEIGTSAQFMSYGRPESLLTNLTSDVMKAYGDEQLASGCDVAIMNVHGHRSTMPEGIVAVRNLFEIYSFDNIVTFIELKGADLKRIFDAYAQIGGAGISGNVRLVIKDRKVERVTIDGKPIVSNKTYHIVTLDYLADGNDHMQAFRDALKIDVSSLTLRDLMIDYIKRQTLQGKKITSKLDGRIVIKN